MKISGFEDMTALSFERLPQRNASVPYPDRERALTGVKAVSPFFMSLNGTWQFKYYEGKKNLPENTEEMFCEGEISVPGCFVNQETEETLFPFSFDPPHIPDDTPIGLYEREFDLPSAFLDRRCVIHFDGVSSCFFVYVNDTLAGMSKGTRLAAEFDITRLVKSEKNNLKVLVFRWSDESYLENRETRRVAGIVKSVSLLSFDDERICDAQVFSDYDPETKEGTLSVQLKIKGTKNARVWVLDENTGETLRSEKIHVSREKGTWTGKLSSVCPWSAENPYLYTVLCEINGQCERIRTGFRRIEKNEKGFVINGVPIHLHAKCLMENVSFLPIAQMKKTAADMKRNHINGVISSFGPLDDDFLSLCDEYGLYVIEEAELNMDAAFKAESESLLSDHPLWEKAFQDRCERMVRRDLNHPSVLAWTLGNAESFGKNHQKALQMIEKTDSSRPVLTLQEAKEIREKREKKKEIKICPVLIEKTEENHQEKYIEICITNLFDFTDLSQFDGQWKITNGQKTFSQGKLNLSLSPKEKITVRIPLSYYTGIASLDILFSLKQDTLYAERGFVIAKQQIMLSRLIRPFRMPADISDSFPIRAEWLSQDEIQTFAGNLTARFNGFGLCSFKKSGTERIKEGKGICPYIQVSERETEQLWSRLEDMEFSQDDGCVHVRILRAAGEKGRLPCVRVKQEYTVFDKGDILLRLSFMPFRQDTTPFSRLGISFSVKEDMKNRVLHGKTEDGFVSLQRENGAQNQKDCEIYYAALLNQAGTGLMIGKPFGETCGFSLFRDEKCPSQKIFLYKKTEDEKISLSGREEAVYLFRCIDEEESTFEENENLMQSQFGPQI